MPGSEHRAWLRSIVLGCGVLLAPHGVAVARAPELPAAPSTAIEIVVVDAATVDTVLRDELALRIPGRTIVDSASVVDVPRSRFAWVGVSRREIAGAQLELVLSDGRAYARWVDAPPLQLGRALAGTLANMLDAIEQGTLVADRTGVATPLVVEPVPPVVKPEPTPVPVVKAPPIAATSDDAPRWWMGPRIGGGALLGVGPPLDLQGLVAGHGAIGVDAMHHRGGTVGLEVRAGGRSTSSLQLVRIRVAITGGWTYTKRRFALGLRGGVSIEPVVVTGTSLDLGDDARTTARPGPLVGALVGVTPGVTWWSAKRRTGLRIGIDLELAGSVETRRGWGVMRFVPADREASSLARAGGIELAIVAVVGGWFALRRAK